MNLLSASIFIKMYNILLLKQFQFLTIRNGNKDRKVLALNSNGCYNSVTKK